MILYHGADKKIKNPSIPLSEIGREFGIGFYVTEDDSLAQKRAERKAKQGFFYDNPVPTVTAFRFDEAAVEHLKVKQLNGYQEEWLDFIMQCYTDIHFVHPYDIVIGNAVLPEATEILKAYRSSAISKQETLTKLQELPEVLQICFSTTTALEYLTQTEE